MSIIAPKHPALRSLIARGLTVDFACSEGCAISAELHVGRAVARSLGLRVPKAAKTLVVGRGSAARITAGRGKVMLTLTAKARKAMRKLRHGQLTLRVTATDAAANASTTTSSIRPKVAR